MQGSSSCAVRRKIVSLTTLLQIVLALHHTLCSITQFVYTLFCYCSFDFVLTRLWCWLVKVERRYIHKYVKWIEMNGHLCALSVQHPCDVHSLSLSVAPLQSSWKLRPSKKIIFGLLVPSSKFSRLCLWYHPNISSESSSNTQPSNSCSKLADIWASCLTTLQPATTAASQQNRHTCVHTLISLDCPHTTLKIKLF